MKSANNIIVLALLGNTDAIETLRKKQEVKPYQPDSNYMNWGFHQVKIIDEDPEDTEAIKNAPVDEIKYKVSKRQKKLNKAKAREEQEDEEAEKIL